jgi:hypothetical protein
MIVSVGGTLFTCLHRRAVCAVREGRFARERGPGATRRHRSWHSESERWRLVGRLSPVRLANTIPAVRPRRGSGCARAPGGLPTALHLGARPIAGAQRGVPGSRRGAGVRAFPAIRRTMNAAVVAVPGPRDSAVAPGRAAAEMSPACLSPASGAGEPEPVRAVAADWPALVPSVRRPAEFQLSAPKRAPAGAASRARRRRPEQPRSQPPQAAHRAPRAARCCRAIQVPCGCGRACAAPVRYQHSLK